MAEPYAPRGRLAGPLAYTVETINTTHAGSIPSAGPAVPGSFGGPGGGPGGAGSPRTSSRRPWAGRPSTTWRRRN